MQTALSRLSSVSLTAREAANDYTDGRAPHMQSPGEPRPSQVSFGSGELPLPYSSTSQYASASKNNSNRQTQKTAPERKNSNCPSPPTVRPNIDSITLATSGGIFRIPTCPPGLSFTSSPFFKVIEVIRPPTILSPSELNFIPGKRPYERALNLRISIDQAEAITYHSQRLDDKRLDFGVQVIMRFAKLDPADLVNLRIGEPKQQQQQLSLSPQPDNFPIHLMLHVNGRPAQLPPLLPTTRPGLDGRRNARPVNITPLLRVSPAVSNTVKLVWTHDYATYSYFFYAVYLARKRSTRELCEALRRHSFQTASVTKQKIIEKLASTAASTNTMEDADLVIENTLPVQLLCPLSKCRIDLPVRGHNCQHIQCYDANTYLLINERKPAWKCPVCDVPAPFHELLVDGLMLEILADTMTENLEEIVFKEDSSWSPVGKFGSPSNSHPAAATASWTEKSPSFPKQALPLSTCPPELPTSSPRFFQPSDDTPVSKAAGSGGGAGGTTSGRLTCVSTSVASAAPSGLESRKRSLPAPSGGTTSSLPRSSPTSSASSQAPESEPGLTIDLTESDEESKVSGKRRPSDKLFPEAIRPRSVGKPPTEPTTGSQRPSSLNSSYPAASTSAFSNMSTFAAGTSSSSSLCSTTSLFCMATTPTTSTCVQSGQKSSDRTDAQPYPYRHQHSYSPSRQLNQQQHHHCESACRGSPNHRG
uniref:E3 SUMO-protein ligase PIAS1 n=3 Tax=Schistocephalus solidus TaxID=70667 RepID=A0A0X3PN85_SCHSO